MKRADLRALLAARGLAPRHRLGQNFLVDPALLAAIPADAGVVAGDRVLEIGPGAGALTERLLAAGAEVVAVEIDTGLVIWLRERFAPELGTGRLRLVEGDALASGERFHPELEAWWQEGALPRVVSNLPYAISGPLLGRLPPRPLAGACLLLQREVAEKAAGGEAGPLPIRLAAAFTVRLGRRVPPEVFWPRPRVDSAFLHLTPRPDRPSREEDAALAELLRFAFAQRRKRLLPRLERWLPEAASSLCAAGVARDARAEEVPPAAWRAAARSIMIRGS